MISICYKMIYLNVKKFYSYHSMTMKVTHLVRRGTQRTRLADPTLWLDVICVNQNAKDIMAELSISEVVYCKAAQYFVFDTPVLSIIHTRIIDHT